MNRSQIQQQIKSELVNFNDFQGKQINSLNDIANSLSALKDSLTSMSNTTRNLEEESKSLQKSFDRRNKELKEEDSIFFRFRKKALEKETEEMQKALDAMADALTQNNIDRYNEERKHYEDLQDTQDEAIKTYNKKVTIVERIVGQFGALAKQMTTIANNYSTISNNLIKISGATDTSVRDTRSTIVHDIISQINRETGNFLNPEKSYQKLVDIANQANIGNLEALEEISRPILIASESMNVNDNELAQLFNKFYTRYNFSSREMEAMVDEIRGNAAGNNATAEATLENISKFQNFIGVYADNTTEMQNMMEAISSETSRLESVGVNSGYIFDFMKQIGQGDFSNSTAIMSLLSASGTNMTWTDAQKLLRSGNADDMKLVSQALSDGAKAIGDRLKDSTVTAEGIKAYGLDAEELYNILSASGVLLTPSQFSASVEGAQSAIESLDGQFNTHADKLTNIMSGASEYLAKIQESIGVGISDILFVITSIYTAIKSSQILQSLRGLGGGSGGTLPTGGGLFTGIGSRLATAGTKAWGATGGAATALGALSVAGVGAGLAGTAYGVHKAYQNASDGNTGLAASYGIGAAGTLVGAGALTAAMLGIGATNFWNPVGWAALIGGGAVLIGSALQENANEISGNAEAVHEQLSGLGESLKEKNDSVVTQLGELEVQFKEANTYAEKRAVLEKSGLISRDDLEKTANSQLQYLIDEYQRAAIAMSNTTDDIIKIADEYYQKIHGEEQSGFLQDLKGLKDQDSRQAAISQILRTGGITDEKLINKLQKYQQDDNITDEEWSNLLFGNKRTLFTYYDKHNLTDQSISTKTMGILDSIFNFNKTYTSEDESSEIVSLYEAYANALTKEQADKAMAAINSSVYADKIHSEYKEDIERLQRVRTFAVGSNYIDYDQPAYLHEGEAVVPKRYNPEANKTELEMLREYYKSNEVDQSNDIMREISSTLIEIKAFLSEWKSDNVKRETTEKRLNRVTTKSQLIANYFAVK